ncbi:MAG: HlyD family efflux transporter periplasmic adaptor subunit, partial [bacterium]
THPHGDLRHVPATRRHRVAAGDVIATLESPELLARTAQARAQVAELQAQLRAARAQDDAVSEQIITAQLDAANDTIRELLAQAEELTVRAPHPGVIASGDPASNLGKLIRKGEPVCLLLEPASARVLALLDQTEAAWLFDLPPEQQLVKLRLASDIPTIINAHVDSIVPAGQSVLPHPSLGYMGGGSAEVDTAQDPSGRIAKGDRFTVYIHTPEHALDNALPGQRVYLRFTLPSKPIAQQVVDRISKAVQGRVNL